MTRFIIILMIGLILEAVGVTFLSKGLKTIGGLDKVTVGTVLGFMAKALANPYLLLGIAFEALFFGILIYLLAQKDVSLVWPLTGLGFVITALAAKFLLDEQVSTLRWVGVFLIVTGTVLVSWSEALKNRETSGSKPQATGVIAE